MHTFVIAAEPVIFATAFDGVRKAFGQRFTPETLAQLKAVGVDFKELQAGYPFATWHSMSKVLVQALTDSGLSEAERYRVLGRGLMPGYVQTTLGFAALATAKLLGVRRTMHRMGRNFRTSGNYTDTAVTDVEPQHVVLHTWVMPEFLPRMPKDAGPLFVDYRQGVLEGTLEIIGAREGVVTVIERDEQRLQVKYDVRWA